MPSPPANPHRVKKPVHSGSTFDGKHISAKKAASFLHSARKQNEATSANNSTPTANTQTTRIVPTKKSEPDWDPKHFRLFVGNLGPDATDSLLHASFEKYATLSNVHVAIDKSSKKPKGFGFVAFADADDYLNAFKEMNGKYIGQFPVQLKRAESGVPKKKKKKQQQHKG
ncbi:uncharacterized protein LODBEIA_P26500 [Lodderomyces beijingensis]|uniref:RRM domain-containing protein n=1 Tax=Lodderomyces beijingensis TaxID=1775926 RepID=A0ABP0ZJW3_9ASCO